MSAKMNTTEILDEVKYNNPNTDIISVVTNEKDESTVYFDDTRFIKGIELDNSVDTTELVNTIKSIVDDDVILMKYEYDSSEVRHMGYFSINPFEYRVLRIMDLEPFRPWYPVGTWDEKEMLRKMSYVI